MAKKRAHLPGSRSRQRKATSRRKKTAVATSRGKKSPAHSVQRSQKVMKKAGRHATLGAAAKPTPTLLPLLDPNFGWERFEEFAHHFVSLLPKVKDCHRYGTRGSEQKGIDLVAKLPGGREGTYQCRQYKRFTKADVQQTIAEDAYDASHHTIIVACTVGTPIRDEIKRHRKWKLLDATDVVLRIRKMDAEDVRALIASHFGAQWAEDFLGVKVIPTFMSPGLFYRELLNPDRAFHHALPLIGRSRELTELDAFVESADQQVLVLSGVGGSGKSRLVWGFAHKFPERHSDWHARVVTDGVQLTPTSARELPVGSCVIIAEDAHRRNDVRALLSLTKHRPGRTKLILITRPYAVRQLRADISWANLSQMTVLPAGLTRLDRKQLLQLAKDALGPSHANHAEALAGAVGDSPLVLIVAAYFLRREAVDPRLLERHEEFQRLVLDRFAEEASAGFTSGNDAEIARKLLPLVAALQPLPAGNTDVHRMMAQFLRASAVDVARILGQLEAAGVLIRRGGTARIVPDVLADHLLHSASVAAGGMSTGYADSVFDAFHQPFSGAVLTNLAELDWRLRSTTPGADTILDNVWRKIRANFESASHVGRGRLLDSLRDVAHLQPERTFGLIEYAIANPSTVPESGAFAEYFALRSSHSRVMDHLPSILKQIAFHLDYLPRCLDILWILGRDDSRATNPNPGHGMRILLDIAEYDLDKPVAVQAETLNAIEKWMNDADVERHPHSPLDVLDPILERTGISHRSTGARTRWNHLG